MEINEETLKMLREMGCKAEHGKSITDISDYIQKHRLTELFNVSTWRL